MRQRFVPVLILALATAASALMFRDHEPEARAQDQAQTQYWAHVTGASSTGETLIAQTPGLRYVVQTLVITDTSSEVVTISDCATVPSSGTAIFTLGCFANTPLVLTREFFGGVGFVASSSGTMLAVKGAAGTITATANYTLR